MSLEKYNKIFAATLPDLDELLETPNVAEQAWAYAVSEEEDPMPYQVVRMFYEQASEFAKSVAATHVGTRVSDKETRTYSNLSALVDNGRMIVDEIIEEETLAKNALMYPAWLMRGTDLWEDAQHSAHHALSPHAYQPFVVEMIGGVATLLGLVVQTNITGLHIMVEDQLPDQEAYIALTLFHEEGLALPDAIRAAGDITHEPPS